MSMARGDGEGSSDDARSPLQSPPPRADRRRGVGGPGGGTSLNTSHEEEDSSNANESDKSPNTREGEGREEERRYDLRENGGGDGAKPAAQSWKNIRAVMAYYHSLRKIKRTKSNQRWMKLRTTVQISSAMQKKPPLKREDSFLKRFSTRQIPENQETIEDTGSEGAADDSKSAPSRRRRRAKKPFTVVNPDENFYFYWLMVTTVCLLYNMWTLIVRESFPEFQIMLSKFWIVCDAASDIVFLMDIGVQLRTGYLEQGLMVYNSKKLAGHYLKSRAFLLDLAALTPLDILQVRFGTHPILRFPRFFKVYRSVKFYYIVESRTVWPNLWRVINLIHILLILAHWFGCFYYLLSEAEGFQGDWVYPYRPGDYATLARKYLGSLYWSTLTLTTIGDLPTPETNAEDIGSVDGPRSLPRRGIKSRLLQFNTNKGYVFTIVSYLIGVFIFATIVGQVGNVITNRNANRLEFERLLDGAKTYMRHHKVPGGMKRRVLRWYDYSWSRGRIQGGGDINTALGLLPDKLKTELALHVNLSVLKKVTIFQECQPEFLHDLVLKMKAYIFTPGDSICRKGEVAREMFIIADGILEVLSENGKVLTTMKAGDFFGEIGILNLDGLNKRTADVRSVGYSELFSLSREDVLAAMKDYPEAQEILQNLGRKRLMEVKASARHQHRKESRIEHQTLDKGLVGKIKLEAKGLKKVIKKTRTHRRSDESLELQPLHTKEDSVPKSVLKRMSRVKSHDLSQEDGVDQTGDPPTATTAMTSPLGAGLPLLQRLRLLKERQDREDRASAAASLLTACPSRSPPCQEELPPSQHRVQEAVGAGLPLLQRVLLLKSREDSNAGPPISPPPTTTAASSTSISVPPPPSIQRPSFKNRIKFSREIIIKPTVESIPSRTPSESIDEKDPPWRRLKKAAIVRDSISPSPSMDISAVDAKTSKKPKKPSLLNLTRRTKHYKSVDDLSPEYGGLPFVKRLKILNERQKLEELECEIKKRSFSLDLAEEKKDDLLTRSHSEGSQMHHEHNARVLHNALLSPTNESNETLERRNLKSILKKLTEDSQQSVTAQLQQPSLSTSPTITHENRTLNRDPTIEGYAIRHSKLTKSVTFDRDTLTSPPPVNSLSSAGENGDEPKKNVEETEIKVQEVEKYGFSFQTTKGHPLRLLKGTIEDQQYYGEMLITIKQLMVAQLQEMNETFQKKFQKLEEEIKGKDDLISQLRAHIVDLERTDESYTESIETVVIRPQASWEERTLHESRELEDLPPILQPQFSSSSSNPSVVLDVESNTDTESEGVPDSEPGYESGDLENSNWEIEMLAAQMRKRRSASLDYGNSSSRPRRRILRGGSADTHHED